MSADLLRRAAVKLREHAEAGSPGPWLTTDAQPGYVFSDPSPERTWLVAFTPVGKPSIPDAELIALVHPPVALALAGLLDRYADVAPFAGWDGVNGECLVALAREILREPQP